MPLAFETRSHGTIAVGFFNVESDMFLVGHYLVFASDLCWWIAGQAAGDRADFAERREVWSVDRSRMGNLHGAMGGWDTRGFLGEVYRLYPFPQEHSQFHQKPRGYQTREVLLGVVARHGCRVEIELRAQREEETFAFGAYVFEKKWWQAVVDYIRRGGMPRWHAEERPGYVLVMAQAVERSEHWLFRD
jgi:hypothetical protein